MKKNTNTATAIQQVKTEKVLTIEEARAYDKKLIRKLATASKKG